MKINDEDKEDFILFLENRFVEELLKNGENKNNRLVKNYIRKRISDDMEKLYKEFLAEKRDKKIDIIIK